MKKLGLLFIAFSFVLVACKKDEPTRGRKFMPSDKAIAERKAHNEKLRQENAKNAGNVTTSPGNVTTGSGETPDTSNSCVAQEDESNIDIKAEGAAQLNVVDGKSVVTFSTGDASICVHNKNDEGEELAEIALLIGAHDEIDDSASAIGQLWSLWQLAGNKSHRKACLYTLSETHLDKLAENLNLERVIIFSEGENGELGQIESTDLISPNGLNVFKSQKLKAVHFYGSHAKSADSEWKELLVNSTTATLDFSHDEISMPDALNKLTTEQQIIDQLSRCKL